MNKWYYFERPTNLALHYLTSTLHAPKNLRCLLGLNLKFIPRQRFTTSDLSETCSRFRQDAFIKAFFRDKPAPPKVDYNPKMHLRTQWIPQTYQIDDLTVQRTSAFIWKLKSHFPKKRSSPNLLPHQRALLSTLRRADKFVIAKCDKNLGPSIIEKTSYIRKTFQDHLDDDTTYKRLTQAEADTATALTRTRIDVFLRKHKSTVTAKERKYIKAATAAVRDPLPKFYTTMKVHKSPLKTRPIVSCSGSLLHPLGV